MAKRRGRKRKYIRVIRHPSGALERSDNGGDYEISGLHYHKANASYYRLDPHTGKRRFYGRDLAEA